MNLMLDANDLSALSPAQKSAIVDSLVLMVAVDRKIEPGEIEVFNAEMRRIPWGLDPAMIDMLVERARIRVKCTLDRLHWQSWVKELAMSITAPALREKVLGTMSKIAINTGKVDDTERGLLNAFAGAFEIPMDRLAELRLQIVNDKLAKT